MNDRSCCPTKNDDVSRSCDVSLNSSCDANRSLNSNCDVNRSLNLSCGVSLNCGENPTRSYDVIRSCDDAKMTKNENDENCGIRRYFVSSSFTNTPFTKYLFLGLLFTQVLSVTILSSVVRLTSLELNKSYFGFIILYWKLSICSRSLKS